MLTSGISFTAKIPDNPFLVAASSFEFKSSIENDFSVVKVKSNKDTFETGTLTGRQWKRPFAYLV